MRVEGQGSPAVNARLLCDPWSWSGKRPKPSSAVKAGKTDNQDAELPSASVRLSEAGGLACVLKAQQDSAEPKPPVK